jgi:hypothetical protein
MVNAIDDRSSSIPWVMTTTSSRVASAISALLLGALPPAIKRSAGRSLQIKMPALRQTSPAALRPSYLAGVNRGRAGFSDPARRRRFRLRHAPGFSPMIKPVEADVTSLKPPMG